MNDLKVESQADLISVRPHYRNLIEASLSALIPVGTIKNDRVSGHVARLRVVQAL